MAAEHPGTTLSPSHPTVMPMKGDPQQRVSPAVPTLTPSDWLRDIRLAPGRSDYVIVRDSNGQPLYTDTWRNVIGEDYLSIFDILLYLNNVSLMEVSKTQ